MAPPKPLKLGGGASGKPPGDGQPRLPKPLAVRAAAPPPEHVPAPAAPRAARPLEVRVQPPRVVPSAHPQDKPESIVQKILAADPSLEAQRHRLRPRVEKLLRASEELLLAWGDQNLQAVQTESRGLAGATGRLTALDTAGWIAKCTKAATKKPSMFDALFVAEDPDYYESKLRSLQDEMRVLMRTLADVKLEIEPDVVDLRLDASTLYAVSEEYADTSRQTIAQRRHRILVSGQQAVVQLLASAEAGRMTVISQLQTLDQLLNVTLPAWRGSRG